MQTDGPKLLLEVKIQVTQIITWILNLRWESCFQHPYNFVDHHYAGRLPYNGSVLYHPNHENDITGREKKK